MNRTYCEASMKFIDVTAIEDELVNEEQGSEVNSPILFKEQTAQRDYGFLEHNLFVLDGSKEEITETVSDIAYLSKDLSDSSGRWSQNPKVILSFTRPHSSAGLTLYFAKDYPGKIKVTWNTLAGTTLYSADYILNSLAYIINAQVSNYGQVVIEFIESRYPHQFASLQFVLFGIYIVWKDSEIKSAKLYEEVNPISETLSINTAQIDILDPNGKFDYMNPNGLWRSIQKSQEVTITEFVNGKMVPGGTFFINDKSYSDNIASFDLIDAVGLLDNYTFHEGQMYSNVSAGYIISRIMAVAGIKKYEVELDVANTMLSGWLGTQSCREALQMVCFACGAIVDDSRSDTISIHRPERYVSHNISPARKFNGSTKAELSEYVSGVSIECNSYSLDSEESEIYNGILQEGLSTITFGAPYDPSSITIIGGALVQASTNYAKVRMSSQGTCVINGKQYNASSFVLQKNVPLIDANETENVKNFGIITLYNSELLPQIAQNILDYYALRKKITVKFLLDDEFAGDWCTITDRKSNAAAALLAGQSVDLTGGFISSAEFVGYNTIVTDFDYTGEIHAGEGALL